MRIENVRFRRHKCLHQQAELQNSESLSASNACRFFLFLFGIAGNMLFSGKLHFRCTEPGASEFIDDTAICAVDADCDHLGVPGAVCKFYETNPSNGALSYDNCLSAFVTIFQAVSLEGWVDQVRMRAAGVGRGAAVFFSGKGGRGRGDGGGRPGRPPAPPTRPSRTPGQPAPRSPAAASLAPCRCTCWTRWWSRR